MWQKLAYFLRGRRRNVFAVRRGLVFLGVNIE